MPSERTPEEREAEAAERARRRAAAAAAGDGGAVAGGSTKPAKAPRAARTPRASRPARPARGVAPTVGGAGLVLGRRTAAIGAGVVALVIAAGVIAGRSEDGGSVADATGVKADEADAKPVLKELPGGGRTIFPARRVVAFYGHPGDRQLGILGIGPPSKMVVKLKKQAAPYARKTRPVLPVLELLSSIAAASPGADGAYSIRTEAKIIDRYHRAARKAGALLLLDIQPGLLDFPSEARRLRKWLKEPDVGLALDPEWRVQPGQIPGKVIGSVSAEEVNQTTAELAKLVKDEGLPEKLLVIHQFTEGMVANAEAVIRRPGLAMVFNIDGFGAQPNKVGKYEALVKTKRRFRHGFKLFYEEDTGLMKPKSVMAMNPRPDMIVYE